MKRIIVFAILLITVTCLVTGCVLPPLKSAESKEESKEFSHIISDSSTSESYSAGISLPDITPAESEDESDYTESSKPEETVSEDNDSSVLYTLEEVRDYIREKKGNDIFDISFEYRGTAPLDGGDIARIAATYYVYYYIEDDMYEVTLLEYPGDRMSDAFFNDEVEKLNSTERDALDVALSWVALASEQSESDVELEIMLHNMLAEHVTYFDGSTDIPDPDNPPRHLTAVGALLDGSANCQGYTDAFYLLATLAGFKVDRMTVESPDGWHILNTVYLDGQWYIVDVTFNDTEYADGPKTSYRLFNAGKDVCGEYEWGPEMEYCPIVEETDDNYYYFLPNGYEKAFYDIEEMAAYLLEMYAGGEGNEFHAVLLDETMDWSYLESALFEAGMNDIVDYYYIWSYTTGIHSYYVVNFS